MTIGIVIPYGSGQICTDTPVRAMVLETIAAAITPQNLR